MNKKQKERLSKFIENFNDLLKSKRVTIQEISAHKEKYKFPAVYIISTPKDKGIYVGKTKTRDLYERIGQHIHQNHKCDLKEMIIFYNLKEKKVDKYLIRYLRIDSNRERGLFEDFVVGIFNPKCNNVHN